MDGNFGDHNSSSPERILAISSSGGDDDVPAYQLACVVDDAAMQITEVVRGADLLVSTARQILLYRALGLTPPAFFHCPLLLRRNRRAAGQAARRLEPADIARRRENAGITASALLLITPYRPKLYQKLLVNFFTIRQSFQSFRPAIRIAQTGIRVD